MIGQDYIRTSRSRGIPNRVITFSHTLKNALIPILTAIGLRFGSLLAGSAIVETVFSIKGVGRFVVDSVSKRYSECGIRIGALITKNKQVRENVMKWCQARLSPPLIGQIMAEASLDTPEEYMRDVYDEYVERRKFLIDGLNRIPGCYSPIPMGAFYTVARLPIDDADKFCAWCLEEFDYEGQTIFMAPASGFYTTPGLGKNEVRLAYVLKKEDLAKALVVLEKALETYNKKGKK